MPIKKVFLSSTARDLKEYRKAANKAIDGLDGYNCVCMENFGARDDSSEDFCRSKVEECDLFVGIVGHLYGSCPNRCGTSYTELEYDAAVGAEIPRLIFVASDAVSPPPSLRESDVIYEKQQAFRKRVDGERIRDFFESPQDLSGKIRQAIHNWEREQNRRLGQKRSFRAPFQAPPLPEHFIPRPDTSEEVKRRILTNISDLPGVLVVSALHGLGGIGKTVLASSLAHDDEVRDYFPDGILWATLGQEPDLLSLLSGWIQALSDHEFHPTTPEAASMHLSTLLHDKTALLVVDDAWNSAHVQPFRVGGPRCSLLITTRDSLIAEAVGARVYDLDVMTERQSLALLSKRLGRELGETEKQEALDLAKEVGYLPLALNLIAAQVEDGVSWAELLDELKAEIARLEALEKPGVEELDEATRRNLSLRASFRLSIQSLPEKKRVAFAWLGVLPEDVLLAPKMATTLWDIDLRGAKDTLRYLRNKALLLPGPKLGDVQSYRLHDLLHDFARNLIVAPLTQASCGDLFGLDLSIQGAHSSLLERYRSQTRDGLWHTLPDDGYIHANLIWHLQKACWIEAIHALFREENPAGKNGWYQAREFLGQTEGFLEDVMRAWKLVTLESGKNKISIDKEIRYALINASIISLSTNIPPELMVALVKNGLWSPIQGLTYARQISDFWMRAKSLTALIPHLNKHYRSLVIEETIEASRNIRDEDFRAEILVNLAPHLSETLLKRALIIARDIDDDFYRVEALSGFIPYLSKALKNIVLSESVITAQNIENCESRESALAELVPRIAESGNIEDAINIMDDIKAFDIRIEALTNLVSYLPEPLKENMLKDALKSAMRTKHSDLKAEMLLSLLPFLEDQLKEDAVNEVLLAAQNNNNASQGVHLLTSLLTYLSEQRREVVLDFVLIFYEKIGRIESRVELLVDIIPYLSDPLREKLISEALTSTKNIYDELSRARSVSYLAPSLSEPLLLEALKITQEIRNDYQNWVLGEFALKLAQTGNPDNAIKLSQKIADDFYKTCAMIQVIPYLNDPTRGELIENALTKSRMIENKYECAYLLSELASYLHGPLGEEVLIETLEIAKEVQQEYEKYWLLEVLASKLPGSLLHEALNIAEDIRDQDQRENLLAELLPRLVDQGQTENALSEILRFKSEKAFSAAIVKIAPHISKLQIKSMLSYAEKIKIGEYRYRAMLGLSPYILDPLKKEEVIRESWEIVRKIDPNRLDVDTLAEIISKLPVRILDEALEIIRSIQDDGSRGFLLAKLARRFSEPVKKELLIEALFSARKDQWEVEYESYRPAAFTELAPELSKFPAEILYQLWSEMLQISAHHKRDDLLGDLLALTPVILALGGQEALEETARAIEDVGRWWP